MRSAQETFKAVIAGGYYGLDTESHGFMCHALRNAWVAGAITRQEYDVAGREVYGYISALNRHTGECNNVMFWALGSIGRAHAVSFKHWFESGAAEKFYLDWDNKPHV